MAYFLGRDLNLAITTEKPNLGVYVDEGLATDTLVPIINDFQHGATVEPYVAGHKTKLFAGPMAVDSNTGNTVFGELTGAGSSGNLIAVAWNNEPDNMVGVDISFGSQDEDVAFIGQRNIMKAEIKKENSITITRKKKDAMWDAIYNQARFGINAATDSAAPQAKAAADASHFFDGLSAPDFVDCGYRVYLQFKSSSTAGTGETFVMRNCYVTEHSVTVSADGSQEESLTLMSYVDPVIFDGATDADLVAATGATEL